MWLSKLTRDGTAEPVSRDQILRRERGQQEKIHFPCSADHKQDSAISNDHTCIAATHIVVRRGARTLSSVERGSLPRLISLFNHNDFFSSYFFKQNNENQPFFSRLAVVQLFVSHLYPMDINVPPCLYWDASSRRVGSHVPPTLPKDVSGPSIPEAMHWSDRMDDVSKRLVLER